MNTRHRLISTRTDWLGWVGIALAAGIVYLFIDGMLSELSSLQQFSLWILGGTFFAFGAIRVLPAALSDIVAYLGYLVIFGLLFSLAFELLPQSQLSHLPNPLRVLQSYDYGALFDALPSF